MGRTLVVVFAARLRTYVYEAVVAILISIAVLAGAAHLSVRDGRSALASLHVLRFADVDVDHLNALLATT